LLDGLCVRVRHAARAVPTASMPVANRRVCAAGERGMVRERRWCGKRMTR
jgi:hypothetical protein